MSHTNGVGFIEEVIAAGLLVNGATIGTAQIVATALGGAQNEGNGAALAAILRAGHLVGLNALL